MPACAIVGGSSNWALEHAAIALNMNERIPEVNQNCSIPSADGVCLPTGMQCKLNDPRLRSGFGALRGPGEALRKLFVHNHPKP